MSKIKSVVFTITKEEIEDVNNELIELNLLNAKTKLTAIQIRNVLSCVECDEFLARDIRNSIKESIHYVLNDS